MNESEVLLDIENLMFSMIQRSYIWKDFEGEYHRLLDQAQAIYDQELTYSPLIENYFALMNERRCRRNREVFSNQDLFQDFQYNLRTKHRKFLDDLKSKNKRNSRKLRDYFDSILKQHCKLLLVRVDLAYRYDANTSLETFDRDIKILVNRIQNKDSCFKGQVGYAYRLEQGGKSKGYHCHLLVTYNGSKHCRDSYLAQEIGELWQERITDDQGLFYNCNQKDHKRRYELTDSLGIGMIERKDPKAVENAHTAIRYLASPDKQTQYLRACLTERMRQFHTGQRRKTIDDRRVNP